MAVLNEEQSLLQEQVKNWVSKEASVDIFRAMRDSNNEQCFDPKTWGKIIELGWSGILIEEDMGGSSMDYTTFGLVLEEMGRGLTASPLFASGYVAVSALQAANNTDLNQLWLPRIAEGKAIVSLAVDEGPHHRPNVIALKAEASAAGFELTGKKCFVIEGAAADAVVVAARTSDERDSTAGISLFLVPTSTAGISRKALRTADSRGYANIEFDHVSVAKGALLGELDQGYRILETTLDRARAGIAAEMLGTGCEAFDRILDYLKTREQFGKLIGSYQALGHRAATAFMDMELARSCVEAALRAIDSNDADASYLCSLAKAHAGDFLHTMSNEMIQMHGGIGMTDEFDAGFFIKRARALESLFGNQAFQRQHYVSQFGI